MKSEDLNRVGAWSTQGASAPKTLSADEKISRLATRQNEQMCEIMVLQAELAKVQDTLASATEPASDCPAYAELSAHLSELDNDVASLSDRLDRVEVETEAAVRYASGLDGDSASLSRSVAKALAAVGRTLRLVRDIERLGPSQGIDLDHQWHVYRPMGGGYELNQTSGGFAAFHRSLSASGIVRTWIKETGILP